MSTLVIGSNLKAEMLAVVQRVEKLMQERSNITADIGEVLAEAEANGLDKKTLREMIKLRKLDKAELTEREYLRDQYAIALGLDLV